MISNDTLKRLTTLTPSGQWTDEAQLKHQLARELLMEREMLDAIRDALPEDAPSRYGDITGVSTLDDVKDLVRGKQKALGLGEHCRQLRLALADALQIVFSELPPTPHEGPCGGPDSQCDQSCADAANAYSEYHRLFRVKNNPPHYFEAEINRLRAAYESEAKWRKAYQDGKDKLYQMGGAIAEAAMQHLPCNEAGVDQFFRKNYVHTEALSFATARNTQSHSAKEIETTVCSDCPSQEYPIDKTRCSACPKVSA